MYVKFVVSVASDRITQFNATKHENPNDRLVSSIRDVSILQILYRFIFIAMVVPVIPIERVRKRRRRKKKKVDKQEKGIKPLTGCRAAAATATAAAAFILALGYILSSEALEEVMLLPPVTTKSCQE